MANSEDNPKIVMVAGSAGAGKSTLSAIGAIYGFKVVEMGTVLKAIEKFIFETYLLYRSPSNCPDLIFDRPDIYIDRSNLDHIYKIAYCNYEEYIKNYSLNGNTKEKQYYNWKHIVSRMFSWYDTNQVIINNNVRRNALQFLGTEILRDDFGGVIHIDSVSKAIKKLYTSKDHVLVPSVRFRNEIEYFSELDPKASIIVINRNNNDNSLISDHPSEIEWRDYIELLQNYKPPSLSYYLTLSFNKLNNGTIYSQIENDSDLHEFIVKSSHILGVIKNDLVTNFIRN